MSKNNNANPNHYKTKGREPQGQDVPHEVQRRKFAEVKSKPKTSGKKPETRRGTA